MELCRGQRLDRCLGAYRGEDGRLDLAVRGFEDAGARPALLGLELEGERGGIWWHEGGLYPNPGGWRVIATAALFVSRLVQKADDII